jgi:hypothetical protein
MKGSKKYMGHEYYKTQAAATGLGKDLQAHKSEAEKSRKNSRTVPGHYNDGGTIQSGISQAASQGGVPHTTVNTMSSVASGLSSAFGGRKAKGGKIEGKPKHKGNDPRNDDTLILASKGEVVLQNSVTQSGKKAPKKAANFMKKEMKKK